MKIYTRTGDKGETRLVDGEKVSKDNLRIVTYGTIDELNSVIGIVISEISESPVKELLQKIQNDLFTIGADLATPISEKNEKFNGLRLVKDPIEFLESEIDKYESQLEPLRNFILPGGSKSASYLHLARTVCRRAERFAVSLSKQVEINDIIIVYLNRLSDLLFVLSRYENKVQNLPDVIWKK